MICIEVVTSTTVTHTDALFQEDVGERSNLRRTECGVLQVDFNHAERAHSALLTIRCLCKSNVACVSAEEREKTWTLTCWRCLAPSTTRTPIVPDQRAHRNTAGQGPPSPANSDKLNLM